MKKYTKFKKSLAALAIGIVLVAACSVSTLAKEPDEFLSDFSAVVPEDYSFAVSDTDYLVQSVSLPSLAEYVGAALSGQRSEIISFLMISLALCALGALACAYRSSVSSSVRFGLSCVGAAALLSRFAGIYSSVSHSLGEANSFFSAVIPIVSAINACGGGVSVAGVQGVGMSLTASLVSTVSSNVLPFVCAVVFSLEMLCTLGADGAVARSAKRLYTLTLGAVTVAFAGMIALQSTVAAAADGAAMRAAKYGVANMIPIVGSTVSSALSVLLGGLGYVRSVVGVGAVTVIVYMLASPLVILLLYRLALSLSVALEEYVGSQCAVAAPLLGMMDCMIASYVLCAALYVFQIVLFLKHGITF